MRRLRIDHVTEYLFSQPVSLLPHQLLLRPRENHNVRIESSVLEIFPDHVVKWKRDVLDNSVAEVSFFEATDRLSISSNVVIQHFDDNPLDFIMDEYAVMHPFEYALEEQIDLAPFLQSVFPSDRQAVGHWLGELNLQRPMETFVLLDQMNRQISNCFSYQMREAQGVQSPAETVAINTGSCRDFAALFMEACRYLGLASRFVSGYLYASDIDTSNASTHAWAEVYLPGTGWKGFDPTNGEVIGSRHIATAVTRHPESVPPVAGSYIGPADLSPTMSVTVKVSEFSG